MKTKLSVLLMVMAGVGCSSSQTSTVADNADRPESSANRSPANWSTYDCLRDAERDGCWFSAWDEANVLSFSDQCRTIESGSGKTKVIVFRMNTGDIVAVRSKDPSKKSSWSCRVNRINTGEGGARDIAARDNKFFFNTNNGHVYYGQVDLKFFEILSNKGNQSDAKKLNDGNGHVYMVMQNNQSVELDEDFLSKRRAAGNLVEVKANSIKQFDSGQGTSPFGSH